MPALPRRRCDSRAIRVRSSFLQAGVWRCVLTPGLAGFISFVLLSGANADPPGPASQEPTTPDVSPPDSASPDSASPSGSEDAGDPPQQSRKPAIIDRDLLRELLPGVPLKPAERDSSQSTSKSPDELDHAVSAMREVSSRLDQRNVSADTKQLQHSIIGDIDKLIDRLKNQPTPQQQPNPPDDENQDQQDQQQSQGRQSQNQSRATQQQSRDQQQAEQSGSDSSERRSDQSAESSETTLKDRERRAQELLARRELINELWGHLPPAMRERLLNVGGEKLLPKYQEQIRRYYESLADPKDHAPAPRLR